MRQFLHVYPHTLEHAHRGCRRKVTCHGVEQVLGNALERAAQIAATPSDVNPTSSLRAHMVEMVNHA